MRKNVLITGGAGFVGSHTADLLLQQGHRVTIFDCLAPQVHCGGLPSYLPAEAEFMRGNLSDFDSVCQAVEGMDAILHLAAAVGVGQSMYEIASYTADNIQGTANLLQSILKTAPPLTKLVVASSMSIYGEGQGLCEQCGPVAPGQRSLAALKEKQWELRCPGCDNQLTPMPTAEDKSLQCSSIYALSKKAQEEMVLLFGATYGIPSIALRYFNIYGPRQSLSNPYTGVAAIFASRLLNRQPPMIFEDGQQMRDFVNVRDVARANLLALENVGASGMALNIGSGTPVTIEQVGRQIAGMMGREIAPRIKQQYRVGDIRHCFGDISRASKVLGYQPAVSFQDGMSELVGWLRSQQAEDRTEEAMEHLSIRGLVA
ncbi:MAG: nucleoside-diphosphate-sugar epimerase [Acidobacteria bacterium]|nr:MAG: nucleoside-diphosphate-sugar epimerase [Acidobacteriota bacterium]